MKKIAIVGAGEFQTPLIMKAKEMGYETHVFAWATGAEGEALADFFYPISIIDKELILEKCREIQPEGVVSIGSDLATITVNHVARAMGLICNPVENDLISTNKYLMREALKEGNVYTPQFRRVDLETPEEELEGLIYPVIVKPTDRSGSRGIRKVEDAEGLREAIGRAVEESFEKKAIVEEFIEGEEYSCECVSYEGEHHFLAFTKKYTTGPPDYIETAHVQPADDIMRHKEKILKQIFQALDILKIRYGASHSEFKVDDKGNVSIIEIGARMGGDCIGSDLVPLSTGYDFVKMTLDIAAGNEPDFGKISEGGTAAICFLFSQEDGRRMERLQAKYPEALRRLSKIDEIGSREVTDSSTRFGYYIFKFKDKRMVQEMIGGI